MVPKLYIIPGAEDRSLTYAAYAAYSNDLPSLQRMVADNPDLINASDNMISPLEAGIGGGSVECVSFILEHPNFDQELSFGLLHALSCIELSEKVETCILTASTALLGEPFCRNTPAPLPSPFTSKFITYSGNFFSSFVFSCITTSPPKIFDRSALIWIGSTSYTKTNPCPFHF